MPGNVPNTSRDSFQFSKMYDSVVLQQGVPIPDSDWNELQDIRRMMDILEDLYVWGGNALIIPSGGAVPGFRPVGAALVNDFQISAGPALVGGVLVMTTLDEPPAAITYDDATQLNFIAEGVVEGFAAGILTESTKNWQAFHDLLASAFHGACRVRYTSGAESGNEYTITAYAATTLTLSGGVPAPGDTYVVLPPELTTPGGARTDEIYLMAWWEDIASEEDAILEHPGLGVETAHRARRRWCVRVVENGATPVTASDHSFDVRYLQIGVMNRTAAAGIAAGEVVPVTTLDVQTYVDHVQSGEVHGVTGNYTAAPVGDINNGGIGTGFTSLEQVFSAVDSALIRRRAFTAVVTDGIFSTGGDFDGVAAGETLIDGTFTEAAAFFVRRGQYTWADDASADIGNMRVSGETAHPSNAFADGDIFTIPVGAILDKVLGGIWEHIGFNSSHATVRYASNAYLRLKDAHFEAGSFRIQGGRIEWHGGSCLENTATPTSNWGLEIAHGAVNNAPFGIIENVKFSGPGSGAVAASAAVGLSINAAAALRDKQALTFRNCEFRGANGGGALLADGCVGANVVFEDCYFETLEDGVCCATITASERIVFRNCIFYAAYGRVLFSRASAIYEDCTFISGASAPFATPQMLVGRMCSVSDTNHATVFRNCVAILGDSVINVTGTDPIIEFNGSSGTVEGAALQGELRVEGLRVDYTGCTDIHRFSSVVCHGPNNGNAHCLYRDLVIDMGGVVGTIDRGNNGVINASAHLELVGRLGLPPLIAENIHVLHCDNPNAAITDSGDIVAAQGAVIRGLEVDGDNASLGAGDRVRLVNLHEDVELHDLSMLPRTNIRLSAGCNLYLGPNCRVLSGKQSYTTPITTMSGLVFMGGDRSALKNFRLDCAVDGGQRLVSTTGSIGAAIENNEFYPTGQRAVDDFTLGVQSRLVGNVIHGDRFAASVVNTANDRVIIDGNTILSTSITAPTVTNTGTGAVTGDNVLAANAA